MLYQTPNLRFSFRKYFKAILVTLFLALFNYVFAICFFIVTLSSILYFFSRMKIEDDTITIERIFKKKIVIKIENINAVTYYKT